MSINQGLNQLSRQQIKSRMLKEASRLWDFQDAEVDSLDPLVNLLMESCAVELEKVGHQIYSSNARVMGRLARLMTPDVITGPQPAHAIVQVKPIEPRTEVNPLLEMSYKKELPPRQQMETKKLRDLKFTPAAVYQLFDIQVRAIASNREISVVDNINQRESETLAFPGKSLDSNTLFLGLTMNSAINNLKGLSFFFDWKNNPQKKEIVEHLNDTQWFLGDTLLNKNSGLDYKSAIVESGPLEELFEIYDMARNHEKMVNDYYAKQFITLKDIDSEEPISLDNATDWPKEMEAVFGLETLEGLDGPMVWIKVVFPQSCPKEALTELYCGTNCIPIVNRELIEKVQSLRHNINVVPLQTEDLFYQMVSVEDSNGNFYYPTSPLTRIMDFKARTYSLRQGEVGRYDERNAFETLSYLVDLLRDEANAFSFLDRDWLNQEVENLNQLLARVENKLEGVYDKESISYIVIKPEQSGENVHIRFYATAGGFANNIPTGTKLKLSAGMEIDQGEIVLATTTKEGREKMDATKSLIAYKQAVLTRNRIVTVADIKAYCHKQMAHKNKELDKIEIEKGIKVGQGEKEGLVRVINILLYPKKTQDWNPEDWEDISISLQAELTQAATQTYPFSVKVVA